MARAAIEAANSAITIFVFIASGRLGKSKGKCLSDRANEILVADAFCLWPRSDQVLF
jgi:hypothetical protein